MEDCLNGKRPVSKTEAVVKHVGVRLSHLPPNLSTIMNYRHKIRSSTKLKENWDGYNSGPISKKIVRYSLRLLKELDEYDIEISDVGPCAGGESILFELNDKSIIEVFDNVTVLSKNNNHDKMTETFHNTIKMPNKLISSL